jgi:hypothetical protein
LLDKMIAQWTTRAELPFTVPASGVMLIVQKSSRCRRTSSARSWQALPGREPV